MPEFTKDWSLTRLHWPELLLPWSDSRDVLEIGCYEGQSTLALLELIPRAEFHVVDPFPFDGQWDRYVENTDPYRRRVTTWEHPSSYALRRLTESDNAFDVIYVDGSHCTDVVLADAVNAWPMLRPGGLMLFDDYDWPDHPPGEDVGKAVDAFTSCYGLTGWVPTGSDQYAIVRPE